MPAAQIATQPFYLDWKFWSVVVSSIAIVLSQLPPVHMLLRRARLDVEVFTRIIVTHRLGNPNVFMHLIIGNVGGREIKVKRMNLQVQVADSPELKLQGNNYFQSPGDKASILLTPFKLKPHDEWTHLVNFFAQFSRQEEKTVSDMHSKLRTDINRKLEERRKTDPENTAAVVADDENVAPLIKFFKSKFCWHPGEYKACLVIETEPARASFSKRFRFTVFESDSKDLEDYSEEYKLGFGVYIDSSKNFGVAVPITEA